MYIFYSLGETPVKADEHWYTLFTGIKPPERIEDMVNFNPNTASYLVFIMNRNPREGIYLEGIKGKNGFSLEDVVSLLHAAKQEPQKIASLHKTHCKKSLQERRLTLEEAGISLQEPVPDFKLLPSLEPFVLPEYIHSESEFSRIERIARIIPFVETRKRVMHIKKQERSKHDSEQFNNWKNRNAAFAHLLYVIKRHNRFEPLKYCPKDNHYWDWLEGRNGNLYVRSVYVCTKEDQNSFIASKEKHPKEFRIIPETVCPIHNPPLRLEDGYYVSSIPVSNTGGIHVRPTAAIVQAAADYCGKIIIEKDGKSADAADSLNLLTLGAEPGSTISIKLENTGSPNLQTTYNRIYRAANNELRGYQKAGTSPVIVAIKQIKRFIKLKI